MIPQSVPDKIITQWMDITRLLRRKMSHGQKTDMGINPMHLHAMMMIREHTALTMTEFAKHLCVTTPSATSLVNRLVKAKLIKRFADKKNRKLVRLKLTDAGLATLTAKMKQHTKMMRDLFALLSPADQREFSRILKTLRATLADTSAR